MTEHANNGTSLHIRSASSSFFCRSVCWKVELEDVLSCDDEVLEEVFQFIDPPLNTVIRVPQMFIAQLRHDLAWFLHLVHDYGIPVFYWTHRQFADAVKKRYLFRCTIFSSNKRKIRPKP